MLSYISTVVSSCTARDGYDEYFRYKVGDKVLCKTSPEEWSLGTIVKLNYREPEWPAGKTVPYQVQVADSGSFIFVPTDMDTFCREYLVPWWVPIMNKIAPPAAELRKAVADKDVNQADYAGNTALSEAVRLNWLDGVRELIGMSANVNVFNRKKTHPLHVAVQLGTPTVVEMTRMLLEAKANPDCKDLDPDFDPEATSRTFRALGNRPEHRTPLHYSAVEGDEATIRVLVGGRAEIDAQDAAYKTPLHLAIEEDEGGAVDALVQLGADVNLCTIDSGMKNTPLMDAVYAGKLALAETLISARADVNRQGRQDMSALHFAVRRGNIKFVRALVSARADTKQGSKCGTIAELARKNGGVELLKLLDVTDETASAKDAGKAARASQLTASQRAALYLD